MPLKRYSVPKGQAATAANPRTIKVPKAKTANRPRPCAPSTLRCCPTHGIPNAIMMRRAMMIRINGSDERSSGMVSSYPVTGQCLGGVIPDSIHQQTVFCSTRPMLLLVAFRPSKPVCAPMQRKCRAPSDRLVVRRRNSALITDFKYLHRPPAQSVAAKAG